MPLAGARITTSDRQTRALGERLGQTMQEPMIITLSGEMGAGKTEFAKGFAGGAGSEPASSPTFAIMNVYEGGALPIYHFDFYRVGSGVDLFEFEEYLYGDGVAIVEWSELVQELEGDRIDIRIDKTDEEQRQITIATKGEKAKRWVERAL